MAGLSDLGGKEGGREGGAHTLHTKGTALAAGQAALKPGCRPRLSELHFSNLQTEESRPTISSGFKGLNHEKSLAYPRQ